MTDIQNTFYVTNGTPPEISSLNVVDNQTLEITYSETVTTATAENVDNYIVTPGSISPLSATKTSATKVTLTFSIPLSTGDYTLTITGVQDTDGNSIEFGSKNSENFTISEAGLTAVKLYPNPVNSNTDENITIAGLSGTGSVSIYDAGGNLVEKDDYDTTSLVFDISGYSAGIYFYVIKNDTDTITGKFAVVK